MNFYSHSRVWFSLESVSRRDCEYYGAKDSSLLSNWCPRIPTLDVVFDEEKDNNLELLHKEQFFFSWLIQIKCWYRNDWKQCDPEKKEELVVRGGGRGECGVTGMWRNCDYKDDASGRYWIFEPGTICRGDGAYTVKKSVWNLKETWWKAIHEKRFPHIQLSNLACPDTVYI